MCRDRSRRRIGSCEADDEKMDRRVRRLDEGAANVRIAIASRQQATIA